MIATSAASPRTSRASFDPLPRGLDHPSPLSHLSLTLLQKPPHDAINHAREQFDARRSLP
jgi:hypothetical protein